MAVQTYATEEYVRGMVRTAGSTERIRRLNSLIHTTPETICLHRARAYTAVFAETEGEPLILRCAQAFKRTLEELPVTIGADELIVGRRACRPRCVPMVPECHGGWLQFDLDNVATREQDPFDIPPEQLAEAKDILARWKGKTLYDAWAKTCPAELADKVLNTGWADVSVGVFFLGHHFGPPWERILNSGLRAFEEDARRQLEALDFSKPENFGKEHFLKALVMASAAIKAHSERYAAEAERLAQNEKEATRRQELLEIADICRRVPHNPATSFREAIQSMWFTLAMLYVEGMGHSYCIGRFDQYMYPFYKADVEKGLLTPEEAQELIEHLYINFTNIIFLYDSQTAYHSAGYTQYQTLSVGGVDSTGKDATNDLSYMCLEAAKAVRTSQPDIVVLCHPRETPYKLKMKGAELVQLGLGVPKFHNTETIKTELMSLGYSREDAGIGWVKGCSEPIGPGGKQYGHAAGIFINMPLSLEMVLFNGRKRTPGQKWSGELLGVETGDPESFATFDQFMDAYKRQVAKQIEDGYIAASYQELVQSQSFPVVVQSFLTDGCVESGKAANAGGAKINVGPGCAFGGGWATVADCLAAVKKLVYEEKKLSMHELVEALDADFEGYENLRQMLMNDAPKFGNDIDYVDDLAAEVFRFATDEARTHTCVFGNKLVPGTHVSTAHFIFGSFVWATPDGRKAGERFSDNIGPADQRDMTGPIAHINSVTKLGVERQIGTIHNMYLTNVDSDDKRHKMIDLIDAYQGRGGHHLQINCISKDVLLAAQKHPEDYPTLMVRVAGYVAYFTDLSKMVQDGIIARTSVRL
jgi:pyruvate formate-lyase/glycerol dehydratase family glycyl radical enzyme